MKGVFVTATGTDVGKTLVSCAIARFLFNRGSSPGVMKPAASGGISRTLSGKKRLVSQDALDLKMAARTMSAPADMFMERTSSATLNATLAAHTA